MLNQRISGKVEENILYTCTGKAEAKIPNMKSTFKTKETKKSTEKWAKGMKDNAKKF